jgi:hypothetical protein
MLETGFHKLTGGWVQRLPQRAHHVMHDGRRLAPATVASNSPLDQGFGLEEFLLILLLYLTLEARLRDTHHLIRNTICFLLILVIRLTDLQLRLY